VDMDISMDIHGKSEDMDMNEKFHIQGKPTVYDYFLHLYEPRTRTRFYIELFVRRVCRKLVQCISFRSLCTRLNTRPVAGCKLISYDV